MAKEHGEIEGKVETLKVRKKITEFNIHTGAAWLIWAALLTWAWYTGKPNFATYAIWLTTGVTAYTTKRLFQKKREFGGGGGPEGGFLITEAK